MTKEEFFEKNYETISKNEENGKIICSIPIPSKRINDRCNSCPWYWEEGNWEGCVTAFRQDFKVYQRKKKLKKLLDT